LSGLRKDLRAMTGDQAASSLMVGIGENYFPAFVLALSSNQLACGLVTSVPLVLGAVLQLIAPAALARWGSYRRWVCACAVLQACSFVPLVAAALWGAMPVAAVFGVVALYWAAGMATGPAWTSWVETLVPESIRAQYFARRTRVGQAGTLLGFAAGGALLQWGSQHAYGLALFAVLFGTAAVSRLVASRFLASQGEPVAPREAPPSPRQWMGCLTENGNGPLFLYLFVVQMAAQISGPYFTPYMLRQLRFSYWDYMLLIATAFLAKIACLPACGRLADRYGAPRLLWLGGMAIVPVSALWAVSDQFYYLFGVQILSGAAWAAYELAVLLLAFESMPADRRVAMLTMYNLVNSTAYLVGSVFGALVLAEFHQTRPAYLSLFLISSAIRAVPLPLLFRVPGVAPTPATEVARIESFRMGGSEGPAFPQPPHWQHAASRESVAENEAAGAGTAD
jgi:MFS family permease